MPHIFMKNNGGVRKWEDVLYLIKHECTKNQLDNQYNFLKYVCDQGPDICLKVLEHLVERDIEFNKDFVSYY